MNGLAIAMPSTPEFGAVRSTGIGASEAAAACGVSEYETPLHVYHRKRGELPEIEDNQAMRLGRRLEPVVRDEFVDATGLEIELHPVPTLRHEEYDFILASPDAWLKNQELLECKTTTWMMAKALGEEGTDDLPSGWVMQVQQQMAVTGAPRAHVAVLLDGRTLKVFVVERQDKLIGRIIEIEAELWQRIVEGRPPEPTFAHPATLDLMRELHQRIVPGEIIPLSADGQRAAWRRLGIADELKFLKEEDDQCKARLAAEIGDAAAGDLGDGYVIRRQKMERKSYVVEATSWIEMRRVKLDTFLKGKQ